MSRKGFNVFFVPLALIVLVLVMFFGNAIAFTNSEKTLIYLVGFLMAGIFIVMSFR